MKYSTNSFQNFYDILYVIIVAISSSNTSLDRYTLVVRMLIVFCKTSSNIYIYNIFLYFP